MDNAQNQQSLQAQYADALAEERLLWKELDNPGLDVNERIKAEARWSAAAERARAIAQRMQGAQSTAAAP